MEKSEVSLNVEAGGTVITTAGQRPSQRLHKLTCRIKFYEVSSQM
jgi:hypothetical protein